MATITRRTISILFCLLLTPPGVSGFALVTEEEARVYSNNRDPSFTPKSAQVKTGVSINVVAPPNLADPVLSPLDIELTFRTDGALIDLSSFSAYYGSFRLDITERILKRAILTQSGLKIKNVQIPKGKHKLLLIISDLRGRSSQREIYLEVD